jgi:spermidine synthase
VSGRRRLFVWLYAASGAAALIYEVTWTRLLTLLLGHTVAAASAVLAAMMGGLAIGAWIAGRFVARHPAPEAEAGSRLRLYAALELAAASIAVLLPYELTLSTPILRWAYADGSARDLFATVRVAITLIVIGTPAVVMGATFPVAADWFARRPDRKTAAADAGALYAWNTLGAAAGALAAGFWLIPAIGLRGSTWIGVALNVGVAGAAWRLARSRPAARQPATGSHKHRRPMAVRIRGAQSFLGTPSLGLASAATAISGFSALVYEVAWTRLLAVIFGPTTYAFSTMTAAFIGGLALGAAAGGWLARRVPRPDRWLGVLLLTAAVIAPISASIAATRVPLAIAALVVDPAQGFGGILARQALAAMLLILPMAIAIGAAFPLAVTVAAGGVTTVGRDVARVYAANTLGALGGALAAGFALIPLLGLRSTFQAMGILGAVGGSICLARAAVDPSASSVRSGRSAWIAPGLGIVVAVALIWLMPPWDRHLLAGGAYKYAPYLAPGEVDAALHAGALEYYKEGAAAIVSVKRLTGIRSLSIDGKVDASTGSDMLTQRLLGLLPVMLHGRAEHINIIGLGSGVTVDSALAAGTVRRADVVEISPEVVTASHFFDRENGRALTRPEVRVIVGDGRSHLLLTRARYDVIISEPSNPWMSGVAALFTREFFEAARAALQPGGVLCQWAHTYDISPEDLRSIVRTFSSVFPRATMWLVGEGDLLLIGAADHDVAMSLDRIARNSQPQAIVEALATLGVDEPNISFALLSLFAGGWREIQQYAGDSAIQTDDRPRLEFSAPRAIYGRHQSGNEADIRALGDTLPAVVRDRLANATAAEWMARGRMELRAEAFHLAYDAFREALALDPRHVEALAALSEAATGSSRQPEAIELLRQLGSRDPRNSEVRVELSRILAATGAFETARQLATDAVGLAPDDPRAGEQLAAVVADAGDVERLAPLADALARRFPGRPDPLFYQATASFLRGRMKEAVAAAREVVGARPDLARAQNLLGAACASQNELACAASAFDASLRAAPRVSSTYVNLGNLRLQAGDPEGAAQSFAEALVTDPASAPAREGLRLARDALTNAR